jgi:cell division protease FtsH
VTSGEIDSEVRRLIEAAHDEAWDVLVTYRDVLDNLVLRLMDRETLSKSEVLEVFATVQKRPSRGSYTGVGRRLPSDRPPVQTPAELGLVESEVGDLLRSKGTTNGHGAAPSHSAPGHGAGGNGHGDTRPAEPVVEPTVTPAPEPGATGAQGQTPDNPRIANPWAPPTWPNDDERRRR